jgi:hypothetical protein
MLARITPVAGVGCQDFVNPASTCENLLNAHVGSGKESISISGFTIAYQKAHLIQLD